jgi:hypothetical protein
MKKLEKEAKFKIFEFAKEKGAKVLGSDGLMKVPQGDTMFVPIIIKR